MGAVQCSGNDITGSSSCASASSSNARELDAQGQAHPGIPKRRICPRADSDLRVSLLDNGLVGPYSATVLVTSFSRGSSTSASRVRSLKSDLHNNTEVQEC
ncbi:hypothetical protein TNCV_5109611 [Trichonephila clavipes]|nr:hypothetical protein TNCV_5109611 [Trichonephila clavipes]